MAYNDSGELPKEQSTYDLGGYSFELKVENVHEPGESDVTSVFAICHSPDGTRETIAKDFPVGTVIDGWCVEANETEASVYALIAESDPEGGKEYPSGLGLPPEVKNPIPCVSSVDGAYQTYEGGKHYSWTGGMFCSVRDDTDTNHTGLICALAAPGSVTWTREKSGTEHIVCGKTYTYNGLTVYYTRRGGEASGEQSNLIPIATAPTSWNEASVAWAIVYGTPSKHKDPKEELIGRFAIDLREADGGPDGDWDEPGDVGPDPEKYYTLTVSVTGASSGSNSGTPLEPGQAGGYGNGGTGGNGGGGGAGASTVIIYEFATSKVDNVVQEATAQGPGTGGPGGKGGKGGDGCILIFY